MSYELSSWPPEQRHTLGFELRAAEVPFEWEGSVLTIPSAFEAQVDALIDELDELTKAFEDGYEVLASHERIETPFEASDSRPMWRDTVPIAARWQRLVGSLVDGLLLGTLATRPLADAGLVWLSVLVGATYWIGTAALWGRSFGKLVAGIRLIDDEAGGTPGWRSSFLRHLVPSVVPTLAPAVPVAWVGGTLAVVSAVVVYAPVLWDQKRQGLHDRVARTVVVKAR